MLGDFAGVFTSPFFMLDDFFAEVFTSPFFPPFSPFYF
jgi:hypothetical protein